MAATEKRVTALEEEMATIWAQLNSLKGRTNAIEQDILNIKNAQAVRP